MEHHKLRVSFFDPASYSLNPLSADFNQTNLEAMPQLLLFRIFSADPESGLKHFLSSTDSNPTNLGVVSHPLPRASVLLPTLTTQDPSSRSKALVK